MYANLMKEMKKRKISINELAKHLEISDELLMLKILGINDFTLKEVKTIIKYFPNVDYDYLLKIYV